VSYYLNTLRRMCSHGKGLEQECLACAMMWRIEQRKDAEISRLRGFAQWVADHSNDPNVVQEARKHVGA
jgi:hypothetical protein